MPRRSRRSGVRFIEDDRDRSLTFFKRRYGIYKAASDLSTLTGARVAVVMESENEIFSSFGTPHASPILDDFLSGGAPTGHPTNEEEKIEITNLQNELFQLEKDKAMEDKRKKENTTWTKDIQETSRMAKYIFGKEENLNATELYEMYQELSRIKREINDRLPTLLQDNHIEAHGWLRDPSLLKPTWWRSMPSQIKTPIEFSPWAPLQASFQQHPWSSSSHQVQARPGSLLPNAMLLPSQQVQPKSQQHDLLPLAPSMVRLQAPPPKEADPCNYPIHGLNINGNNSHSLSLSPILCSPPTEPLSSFQNPPSKDSPHLSLSLQFSSPVHLESKQFPLTTQHYNSLQPSQSYANSGSSMIYSHHSSHGSSPRLNLELGNTRGNRGQTSYGHGKGINLSTPQQGDGWPGLTLEMSSAGQSSNGGDAGSNLSDLNFPWY